MDEKLLSDLKNLNELVKMKAKFSSIADASTDQLVKNKLAGKESAPSKKDVPYMSEPSKSGCVKSAVPLIIALGIFLVLAISLISSISRSNSAKSIAEYPGAAYEEWIEEWDNVQYFAELERSWGKVQQDWKSRGIDVNFEYLTEIATSISYNLNSDNFTILLLGSIVTDNSSYFEVTLYVLGIIISLIFVICFANIFSKTRKKYAELSAEYTRYKKKKEDAELFNSVEYPRLKSAYDSKVARIRSEIKTLQAEAREQIAKVEECMEPYLKLIAPRYYPGLDSIIEILEYGRADDLRDAISIYIDEEDRAAARRTEMRRLAELAEHEARMESLAMQQVRAAEEAARAQDRAAKAEEMAARIAKEAADAAEKARREDLRRANDQEKRAQYEARRRCYNCKFFSRCTTKGNLNCSGYQPK